VPTEEVKTAVAKQPACPLFEMNQMETVAAGQAP
jgi:hypothetical protein